MPAKTALTNHGTAIPPPVRPLPQTRGHIVLHAVCGPPLTALQEEQFVRLGDQINEAIQSQVRDALEAERAGQAERELRQRLREQWLCRRLAQLGTELRRLQARELLRRREESARQMEALQQAQAERLAPERPVFLTELPTWMAKQPLVRLPWLRDALHEGSLPRWVWVGLAGLTVALILVGAAGAAREIPSFPALVRAVEACVTGR